MTSIAIVYFSGYGHTKKQAEAVEQGARSVADAKVELSPSIRTVICRMTSGPRLKKLTPLSSAARPIGRTGMAV
jgi:hypothetical protein